MKDESSADKVPKSNPLKFSESEVQEIIDEMGEQAESVTKPEDRRALYSSISPRDEREAA